MQADADAPSTNDGDSRNSSAAIQLVGMALELQIVIFSMYPLIFLLGLAGNTMVIVVIVKNAKMRNATNYLVMALAIADLLFIVMCVPYTLTTYTFDGYAFGDSKFMCKIPNYMIFVTCLASVYTLVLMSIDRYIAVVHPTRSAQLRTGRNVAASVASLWIIFLGILLPVAFEYDLQTSTENNQTSLVCINVEFHYGTESGRLFFLLFLLFGFVIPLSVVMIFYGLVVNKLFVSAKTGQAIRKSKHRVTRMIVIVIVCFAACWIPQHVMFMIQFNLPNYQESVPEAVDVIANLCAYMNSCINPILYAFLSKTYRTAFQRLLASIFRISNSTSDQPQRKRATSPDTHNGQTYTRTECTYETNTTISKKTNSGTSRSNDASTDRSNRSNDRTHRQTAAHHEYERLPNANDYQKRKTISDDVNDDDD